MRGYEEVVKMTEDFVKQLETLPYTKQRDLALKLTGEIDACIQICGITGDAWNVRVSNALKLVMLDRPSIQPVTLAGIPTEILKSTPPVSGVPQLLPSVEPSVTEVK